jgi:hypothetical protein
MKGVLPWLVRWACRASKRDFCSALAALVGPVQNIFSSLYTIQFFVPIAQQVGQAAVLGRLSISIFLCVGPSGLRSANTNLQIQKTSCKIYELTWSTQRTKNKKTDN